jgi:hypothetical protein
MGAAEPVLREDRIGLCRKVAIGEEQQLDALADILVAEAGGVGRGIYVSHIDLFRKHRYNGPAISIIKFP